MARRRAGAAIGAAFAVLLIAPSAVSAPRRLALDDMPRLRGEAPGAHLGRALASGDFDCDEQTEGTLHYESGGDIVLRISADDVTIAPSDGRLDIAIGMTLYSDPVTITAQGPCVLELDEVCAFALQPTPLNANIAVDLALQEGELAIQVESVEVTHGDFGNPIETGCVLGDALATLGGYGIDLIGGVLDSALAGQIAELETQLQGSLDGLTQAVAIETQLDIQGALIDMEIKATSLFVSETGLDLRFSSRFGAAAYGSCIPADDSLFLATAHDPPAITGIVPDTNIGYHVGVVVSQDLVNQALFAIWQGGALCLDLTGLLPIEINSSFLEPDLPELIPQIWPEPHAFDLRVRPLSPPIAVLPGGPRIEAALGLDIYGQELDRSARHWGHSLYVDAGIGIDLSDGVVALDLDFDIETHLGVTISYNEWLPTAVAEAFAAKIPTLVGAGLDVAGLDLDNLPTFPMPAAYGLTLTDLDLRVVGQEEDFLGLYGWIDPTQVAPMEIGDIDLSGIGCGDASGGGGITVPGCENGAGCGGADAGCAGGDTGGCGGCGGADGSGCGGCSQARRGSPRLLLGWAVTMLLILRRRRRL